MFRVGFVVFADTKKPLCMIEEEKRNGFCLIRLKSNLNFEFVERERER